MANTAPFVLFEVVVAVCQLCEKAALIEGHTPKARSVFSFLAQCIVDCHVQIVSKAVVLQPL